MPDDWCESVIITPICKKGGPNDQNNYRGILLLSCVGKMFTSYLSRRVTIFIENNTIAQTEQAAISIPISQQSLADFYLSKPKR